MALEDIFHRTLGVAVEEGAAASWQRVPDERTPLGALLRRQVMARRRGRSLQVMRQLELERGLIRSGR